MLNFNKVILCGVVCNTPELRQNGSGTSVTNFTLKTIEKWKNKSNGQIKTFSKYHKIVVWGKDAETAIKFIRKNVIALVEGSLNYHKYTNKEGEAKNIAEIKASHIKYQGVIKRKGNFKKQDKGNGQDSKPIRLDPTIPSYHPPISPPRQIDAKGEGNE